MQSWISIEDRSEGGEYWCSKTVEALEVASIEKVTDLDRPESFSLPAASRRGVIDCVTLFEESWTPGIRIVLDM